MTHRVAVAAATAVPRGFSTGVRGAVRTGVPHVLPVRQCGVAVVVVQVVTVQVQVAVPWQAPGRWGGCGNKTSSTTGSSCGRSASSSGWVCCAVCVVRGVCAARCVCCAVCVLRGVCVGWGWGGFPRRVAHPVCPTGLLLLIPFTVSLGCDAVCCWCVCMRGLRSLSQNAAKKAASDKALGDGMDECTFAPATNSRMYYHMEPSEGDE